MMDAHPSLDRTVSCRLLGGEDCSAGLSPALIRKQRDVDIYTIIFLALAVFIFLRLRNVLGQRTGSERPPFDRAARNAVQAPDNNVITVPGKLIDPGAPAPVPDAVPAGDRWKDLVEPGSALA